MKTFNMYFTFIKESKKEIRTFKMEQNPFNSNYMYTSDNWYNCKVGTLKSIKEIIKTIINNSKVSVIYIDNNFPIKGVTTK